jgi:hypothetical protein
VLHVAVKHEDKINESGDVNRIQRRTARVTSHTHLLGWMQFIQSSVGAGEIRWNESGYILCGVHSFGHPLPGQSDYTHACQVLSESNTISSRLFVF